MELELKLEWLDGGQKILGGQAAQICLTLPQAIPTSTPFPFKKFNERKNCCKNWRGNRRDKLFQSAYFLR